MYVYDPASKEIRDYRDFISSGLEPINIQKNL
jgi:hypothetical protein